MKVLGLIAEYNPFHNGHKYHLSKSIELTNATHVIAIMSGNFLQRGEPAILHKWARAKMAVKEGIDLVIELPVVYACNSAEFFAYGSISLLDKLNIVDAISFGSEDGDIKKIIRISEILAKEPSDYKIFLKKYLSNGLSFPKARQYAISEYLNDEDITLTLSFPNNILGIEYIKTLLRLNSSIRPYTLKRYNADYYSTLINDNICSATAIRNHVIEQGKPFKDLSRVMPQKSFDILADSIHSGFAPISYSAFEENILYIIRRSAASSLSKILDVNEGLENRIKKAAYKATNYYNMLREIKTKRYPLTRLQRIMIHALLGITEKDILEFQELGGPQYARILAFSKKGAQLLNILKTKSEIAIVKNVKKYMPAELIARKMLDLDILATDIYSLGYPNKKLRIGKEDYYRKPYIQK